LRKGWSPEQIAGRLKEIEHPTDQHWNIHHETIYQFIYSKDNKDKKLWEYLPRKQKKRKKQTGRSVHRSQIPNRVSIHNRPEKVNKRSEFGHWEGDSVEGKRSEKDGIHTEVERVSRLLAAQKMKTITSKQAVIAQIRIFKNLPKHARRSTTLDNGKEHHHHSRLWELKMSTYFADPYSSWQRGTNENTNGLLRRYLPKGSSFQDLAQDELEDIVEEINNRPRKVLGYNTPREVFEKLSGVALQSRM
jgi:transposase, IS30 family